MPTLNVILGSLFLITCVFDGLAISYLASGSIGIFLQIRIDFIGYKLRSFQLSDSSTEIRFVQFVTASVLIIVGCFLIVQLDSTPQISSAAVKKTEPLVVNVVRIPATAPVHVVKTLSQGEAYLTCMTTKHRVIVDTTGSSYRYRSWGRDQETSIPDLEILSGQEEPTPDCAIPTYVFNNSDYTYRLEPVNCKGRSLSVFKNDELVVSWVCE
jgi:hypothetical protein